MKKFFSLIALVAVFAACKPEDLSTAFSVGGAQAIINVAVFSAVDGNVTSSASVNLPEPTKNSVGAIPEQDLSVTATYKGATGSTTIKVGEILAGGKGYYNAVVFIDGVAGDYLYSVENDGEAVSETATQYLAASKEHGYAFSHAGYSTWLENASEKILSDKATFTTYTGYAVENVKYVNPNLDSVADLLIVQEEDVVTAEETLDFQVSAWSLYNVFGTVASTIQPKKVVATKAVEGANIPELGTIATFDVVTKDVTAQYKETAHPDYTSHYKPGHGTGHGKGNNAGGGLIDAE